MDILLFAIGLFFMFRNKSYWTLAIIFILASNYLELNTGTENSMILPGVKVTDLGLILYVFLFSHSIFTYGIYKDNPLQKMVLVFLLFVLLNASIDIISGVAISDIIKVCRRWVYFTIVWIKPLQFNQTTLKRVTDFDKLLKIILIFTIIFTALVIYQNVTKNYFWGVSIGDTRGIKPPFYVMLFIPLLFFNAIKLPQYVKWTFISIMLFAVIMNLKQTYLVTTVLTLILYLLLFQRKRITFAIGVSMLLFIGVAILYNSNDKLKVRIDQSLAVDQAIRSNSVEDNFSFRLLLAAERFDYIMKKPQTAIRGMGFIHEDNVPENLFLIGTYSVSNERIGQAESADIAWAGFFIRLGLLGTFIFLIMFFGIIVYLYKLTQGLITAAVFCSFMIVLVCFTSLGNAVMFEGYFYILPLSLLTVRTHQNRMYKVSRDISHINNARLSKYSTFRKNLGTKTDTGK